MGHPYDHAVSSAKKWGGTPEDYQAIHDWFDESKSFLPDWRHRALRHHSQGIFQCEEKFGVIFARKSDGVLVRTRPVGEQHVIEDLGWIPTLSDWLTLMPLENWMGLRVARRKGARTIQEAAEKSPVKLYDVIKDVVTSHLGHPTMQRQLTASLAKALGIMNPYEEEQPHGEPAEQGAGAGATA